MILLIVLTTRSTIASASPPANHVPEPLRFDLVRGLGANAGELEGNVLLIVPAHGSSQGIEWAPEVTFPRPRVGRFAHGLQSSVRLPFVGVPYFHLIHVMTANVGARVGLMGMLGPRLVFATHVEPELLVNGALFVSLRPEHAVGIEVNWVRGREHGEVSILPQLHLRLGPHARLQLGIGARRSSANERMGRGNGDAPHLRAMTLMHSWRRPARRSTPDTAEIVITG